MWVKCCPLQFIIDNGSQNNLISTNFKKWLDLETMPQLQSHTISWIIQGWDLCFNQQCHLPYNIKPLIDEVLCDASPLDFCDVLLGQPYFWKFHVVYESKPHIVVINLGIKLCRIPYMAPTTSISFISPMKCSKIISLTRIFLFFFIHS